jgi:hypothetical protein
MEKSEDREKDLHLKHLSDGGATLVSNTGARLADEFQTDVVTCPSLADNIGFS